MACGKPITPKKRKRFDLLAKIIGEVMQDVPFEVAAAKAGFTPEEARKAFDTEVMPMNAEAYRVIATKLGW